MTNEKPEYEDLMENEWSPMTTGKAFELRAELRGWRKTRQIGGYDVRLIEGAIAVCDAYIRRPGNMEGIPGEKRPTQKVDHEG